MAEGTLRERVEEAAHDIVSERGMWRYEESDRSDLGLKDGR